MGKNGKGNKGAGRGSGGSQTSSTNKKSGSTSSSGAKGSKPGNTKVQGATSVLHNDETKSVVASSSNAELEVEVQNASVAESSNMGKIESHKTDSHTSVTANVAPSTSESNVSQSASSSCQESEESSSANDDSIVKSEVKGLPDHCGSPSPSEPQDQVSGDHGDSISHSLESCRIAEKTSTPKGANNSSSSPRKGDNKSSDKKSSAKKSAADDMSFQQEKDEILQLPLDKKRELYACEDQYTQLKDILTWSEFYAKNQDRLVNNLPKEKEIKKNVIRELSVGREMSVDVSFNEKVSIWQGDITTLEVDAIVNAANNSLLGGGGVDGAIHRAAGRTLVKECQTLHGCDTGDAKITGGYKLPAKYVIHTVGPIGENKDKLQSCYDTCLNIVWKHRLKSIAFPCISTGIYGYPNDKAAHVVLSSARRFLEKLKLENKLDVVDRIIFCLFLPVDISLYEQWMPVYFPVADGPFDPRSELYAQRCQSADSTRISILKPML